MKTVINRQTVDLSTYPDLVVIYLGIRVQTLGGLKTLFDIGPKLDMARRNRPEGLLHFENNIIFSLSPLHIGMRWYWENFEAMERWARSEPHRHWWQNFLRDSGGTGFWHETYFMRGGMEAVYDDVAKRIGFQAFAPVIPARGAMFSSRQRLGKVGEPLPPPNGMTEQDIY